MARKPTALAGLDIQGEGLAQQDGLAERIAKQRGQTTPESASVGLPVKTESKVPQRDANAWRQGKSLIQVAIPEDIHMEISIIAKRRRINLSQLVKAALNDWLTTHGYQLKIPD